MAQEWQINLKKNEVAPYDGVLVPYDIYTQKEKDILEKDELSLKIMEYEKNRVVEDPRGFGFISHGIAFTVGIAAGIGGVMLLKEVLK